MDYISGFIVGLILTVILVGLMMLVHAQRADCQDKGGALLQGQCVRVEVIE